ncbi:MAG: VOC family protein [Deltaproteobacteria bacterium]|nr:VOC family protein [Deltaproteobacteria bacterium]
MKILGLDHVVLRVADLDRALAWSALVDLVDLAGPLGQAGGAAPAAEGRNVDHFCLRIEPFEEELLRAHLSAHGVEPGDVGDRYGADGTGPSMYIRDPDGNTVELKGPPYSPAQTKPRSR